MITIEGTIRRIRKRPVILFDPESPILCEAEVAVTKGVPLIPLLRYSVWTLEPGSFEHLQGLQRWIADKPVRFSCKGNVAPYPSLMFRRILDKLQDRPPPGEFESYEEI